MDPWTILKEAIKQVPGMVYALAVVALCAAVLIITRFGLNTSQLLIGSGILVGFMIIVLVFIAITKLPTNDLRLPALSLLWFGLCSFFVAVSIVAYTVIRATVFSNVDHIGQAVSAATGASNLTSGVIANRSAASDAGRNLPPSESVAVAPTLPPITLSPSADAASTAQNGAVAAPSEASDTDALDYSVFKNDFDVFPTAEDAPSKHPGTFTWTLCNRTDKPVVLALAFRGDGQFFNRFIVKGWWELDPGQCSDGFQVPRGDVYYHVHGMTQDGDKKGNFCVPENTKMDFERVAGDDFCKTNESVPFDHQRVRQQKFLTDIK